MKQIVSTVFFLILFFSNPILRAADFGTLIHTIGDIQYQRKSNHDWSTPFSGMKLYWGDTIKTSARSAALILNPDGTLIMVDEARLFRYHLYEDQGYTLSGLDTLLGRFFAMNDDRPITSSRGSLLSQKNWIQLMGKDHFSPRDLELAFEMINYYNKTGRWNRVSAILMKLNTVYPENPGFYQLSRQVLAGYQPRVDWRVTKVSDGRKSELEDGSQLVPEDTVFIHYYKNEESYCYLFVTFQPKSGGIETRMLFPKSINSTKLVQQIAYFESRQEPKAMFHFPVRMQENPFAGVAGRHHYWGWSCEGPVQNSRDIEMATRQIEQLLLKGQKLTKNFVSLVTPDLCRSSFSRSLETVPKRPLALNH
ncbi:hypothetical protein KKI24_03570 [bacterium]|nr:hypothetical protein [bacterium]